MKYAITLKTLPVGCHVFIGDIRVARVRPNVYHASHLSRHRWGTRLQVVEDLEHFDENGCFPPRKAYFY